MEMINNGRSLSVFLIYSTKVVKQSQLRFYKNQIGMLRNIILIGENSSYYTCQTKQPNPFLS